jgi:hypothetical protein
LPNCLRKSNGNRRGSCVEGEIYEAAGKVELYLDHVDGRRPSGKGGGYRDSGGNHHMRCSA